MGTDACCPVSSGSGSDSPSGGGRQGRQAHAGTRHTQAHALDDHGGGAGDGDVVGDFVPSHLLQEQQQQGGAAFCPPGGRVGRGQLKADGWRSRARCG